MSKKAWLLMNRQQKVTPFTAWHTVVGESEGMLPKPMIKIKNLKMSSQPWLPVHSFPLKNLTSSPIDDLGDCAGGDARQNASLNQGAQVSMATQRVPTTTRHCPIEKLSGDTCQPLYSPRPAKKERKGKCNLLHKCMIWSSKLHDHPEQVCIIRKLGETLYVE